VAEQLELFPDIHEVVQTNQKRLQLSFLMGVPDRCVDDYLIMEAFRRNAGCDLITMAKEHLTRLYECNAFDLVQSLRDQKLREILTDRLPFSSRKFSVVAVRPEPMHRLRLFDTV
jgi:hypothetical protein